jgi:uncharacterized protein (TIGR02118 family)
VIKAVSLLVRKDGMTHEQFVTHWLDVHGPLARAVPGIRRYVQSHLIGDRKRSDIPSMDVEIDGIAELWYDDRESMERSAATPRGEDPLRRRGTLHRPDPDVPRRREGDHLLSRPAAFVTGASYGIGAATALALARDGFDVAVSDLEIDDL